MHYWFYELKFSRFRDILYAVMRPKQTNKKSSLRFLVVFSIWHWRMLVRECKKVLPRCPTHLCHCEPSQMAWQSSKLCTHAIACDFIIHWIATVTAFPREDKKHRTKFPSMEGCRAAAGWFIHLMILCYLMSFPSPLKHPYIQNILDLFSSNIDYLLQNLYFWFDRVHIVNRFW